MVKQIEVIEAKELLEDEYTTIVDIRDSISFDRGHVDESLNVTQEQLSNFIQNSDKSSTVLVMCYHGISSQIVGQYLVDKGFSDVYSIIGGYEAWEKSEAKLKKSSSV